MPTLRKLCLVLAGIAAIALIGGLIADQPTLWNVAAVALAVGLAIGLGAIASLSGYQYTAWIVAAVVAAMIYPATFLRWGEFDLRNKWLVLLVVQAVMFGMGTQMKLRDFAGVLKMPWGVIVAVSCQFLVMPLTGYLLTKVFTFSDEIAAGIILIGCCSSGLASNVMTFLARGNLPLSITATAVTTLLAPIMTPLWMKLLAGTLVEVKFFNMMMEIVKIVIVPIGAALLHDYLKNASPRGRRVVQTIAMIGTTWLLFLIFGGWHWLERHIQGSPLIGLSLLGFFLGAVVAGVVFHRVATRFPIVEQCMPLASMAGIVYFTTVTTAAGRDHLLHVGGLLFLAAALHNAAGYFFGYWLSRGCGLDRTSARTVAFEVGLQNGGMASGIAGAMGKLGTLGLAAAIFSPWMNISGSILANYWRRKSTGSENH